MKNAKKTTQQKSVKKPALQTKSGLKAGKKNGATIE